MDLTTLKDNKVLWIIGGAFVMALIVSTLAPSIDLLTILKGIIGVPLMAFIPGWIWLDVLSKRKWLHVERLAYSFMISIVLVGWTAYGLRAFLFDEISGFLIMGALLITIGLGILVRIIQLNFFHGAKS